MSKLPWAFGLSVQSEREFRNRIENKKGKRDADEKQKEKAEEGSRALLKSSIERIYQVIRNPKCDKRSTFLEGFSIP